MGLLARIGRPGRAALLLAVGLAGGGTAFAVASVAGSDGVINACYSVETTNGTEPVTTGPNLRIIDPSAGQACATTAGRPLELPLNWNVTGPQGPPGTQGPPGAPGATGGTVTVGSGHTITIPGGHVVTVGGSPGLTLAPLPIRTRGASLAQGTLGTGRQALGFAVLAVGVVNASGGGGGAGKVTFHDISITKHVDKSSPKLLLACASGKHFPTATITLSRKGKSGKPQVYLKYELTNVLVTSVQQSNGGGGDKPTESVSLNFTKIKVEY